MDLFSRAKEAASSAAKTVVDTATDVRDEVTGRNEIEKLQIQLKRRNDEIIQLQQQVNELALNLQKERAAKNDVELSFLALKDEIEGSKNTTRVEQEKKQQEEAAAALAKVTYDQALKQKAISNATIAYNALSGFSVEDVKVIRSICFQNNTDDLQLLQQTYLSQFGKDLRKMVNKNMSGGVRTFLLGLLEKRYDYLAKCCDEAFGTMSTDNFALVSVLCPLRNEEIIQVKNAYQQRFGKDLLATVEKSISSLNGSSSFKQLLTIILQARRESETTVIDPARIQADAKALYDAGQGKTFGVDEFPFINIIANRSGHYLKTLNESYCNINQKKLSLFQVVEAQLSGSLRDGLLSIFASSINRPRHFAMILHSSMQGIGFNEPLLLRTIVMSRDTVEWPKIVEYYNEMFAANDKELNLTNRIIDETKSITGPSYLTLALVWAINANDLPPTLK